MACTTEEIEKQWVTRAVSQGYKPGTIEYRRAEVEFFCGAMAALGDTGLSPGWIISILSSRPVVDYDLVRFNKAVDNE